MKHIKLAVLVALTVFGLPVIVQAETDYGYIKIQSPNCDVPIYVDGGYVGHLPLSDSIKVLPGEHSVSFLNGMMTSKVRQIDRTSIAGDRIKANYEMRLIDAGTQLVYVQPGETRNVYMDATKMETIRKNRKTFMTLVWTVTVACLVGVIVLAAGIE
ncbi:hypothetical protein KAX06_05640 [candidate division WOR-3 bacterium]|nr:hypothetical protein [candidate division WOR-3 bacterium]